MLANIIMNKWQIICPVSAMLIFGLVALWSSGHSMRRAILVNDTRVIALELVATTNSPRIAELGSGLRERLTSFLSSSGGVAQVKLGDEPAPIGNGRACSRLILTNSNGESLGVRLRLDSKSEKYHVLGFWSIREPKGAANGSEPIRSETNQGSAAPPPR